MIESTTWIEMLAEGDTVILRDRLTQHKATVKRVTKTTITLVGGRSHQGAWW